MTDENEGPAPQDRPEFNALIAALRALSRRQERETIAKAEQRRVAVSTVMRKAADAFGRGELTALDVARLHALRMRLDGGLLPEER